MWNLSGDDIERAKSELTGRRTAIQAQYDNDIKQVAADLAALETFERAAVSFVANYKGQNGAPANAGPELAELAAVASVAGSPASQSAAAGSAADHAPAAAEKGSSRWRMRLGAKDPDDEP